jgi:hypothetical protein
VLCDVHVRVRLQSHHLRTACYAQACVLDAQMAEAISSADEGDMAAAAAAAASAGARHRQADGAQPMQAVGAAQLGAGANYGVQGAAVQQDPPGSAGGGRSAHAFIAAHAAATTPQTPRRAQVEALTACLARAVWQRRRLICAAC